MTERAVFRRDGTVWCSPRWRPGSTSGRTCWPTPSSGPGEPGARRCPPTCSWPNDPGAAGGVARSGDQSRGTEVGRSVAMETDAQELESGGDATIQLAGRRDSGSGASPGRSAPVLTFVVLHRLRGAPWSRSSGAGLRPAAARPTRLVPKLYQARQALWQNTVITLREIVIAALSVTVAPEHPLGCSSRSSLVARRIAYPVLVFIQLVPRSRSPPVPGLVRLRDPVEGAPDRPAVLLPLLLASIAGFQALDTRLLYPHPVHGGVVLADVLARAWFPSALHVIFARPPDDGDDRRDRMPSSRSSSARYAGPRHQPSSRPASWTPVDLRDPADPDRHRHRPELLYRGRGVLRHAVATDA